MANGAQRWTDETDTEADEFFATLTDKEIRRRQDLCFAQKEMAREQRNASALADLDRMDAALARAMASRG